MRIVEVVSSLHRVKRERATSRVACRSPLRGIKRRSARTCRYREEPWPFTTRAQ